MPPPTPSGTVPGVLRPIRATPDWFAGFPLFHFYMVLPSLVIALLSYILPYGMAFKIVTILAGVAQVSFLFFVISCIVARGARFFAMAWALRRWGEPIRDFIERRLGLLAAIVAGLVIMIYMLVKYSGIAGSMTSC